MWEFINTGRAKNALLFMGGGHLGGLRKWGMAIRGAAEVGRLGNVTFPWTVSYRMDLRILYNWLNIWRGEDGMMEA